MWARGERRRDCTAPYNVVRAPESARGGLLRGSVGGRGQDRGPHGGELGSDRGGIYPGCELRCTRRLEHFDQIAVGVFDERGGHRPVVELHRFGHRLGASVDAAFVEAFAIVRVDVELPETVAMFDGAIMA